MSESKKRRQPSKTTRAEEEEAEAAASIRNPPTAEDSSSELDDPLPPNVDLSQYRIAKRVPHHAAPSRTDVYVSRKSRPMAQLAHIRTLLLHPDARKRVPSVAVFGLGAAMSRAVELALRVAEAAPVELVTTTGTLPLHDDYEPLVEGLPAFTRTRHNSFVRIELSRRAAGR